MKLQIEKHNTADNRGQKYLSADKIKQATINKIENNAANAALYR